MTRSILVFALSALLALASVSWADPRPTPIPGVKDFKATSRYKRFSTRQSNHLTPTPSVSPASQHIQTITGPTQVGSAPKTSSQRTMPDTASRPGGHVITTSAGSSERIFVPNEYNEPDSPAAGPGFRSTGAPPASYKTKSQNSNVVSSTATRKVATKVLIPSLSKNAVASNEEANADANIDVNPPTPSELGAPIVIPMIPRYDAVPRSKALFLPDGNAPVPISYSPPGSDAPTEVSPTSLRAWNGEMTRETRTFDQTRVQVATGPDGVRRWQFFWRASGAKPRAARWEISTAPFIDEAEHFPPAGLVAYGDASVNAQLPVTENFFSIEFNSLAKNFGSGASPSQLYLRVVPVDGSGQPAAKPSNWIRVDLP